MKRILAFCLVSVMLLATACSSATTETSATSTETEIKISEEVTETALETADETVTAEAEVSFDVQYPLTVTDQAGRTVVIESEPERIVSGYYISTSLLIALEVDDRLVAIEGSANKRPVYALSAPELIDLPNVGSLKEFDLEACVAAEPDLVIIPVKLSDVAVTLEELGITVILVLPETEELFIEMADLVGTATNTVEKEKELVEYITGVKELLNTSLEDVEPTTIYLSGISDFLLTAPKTMYQSDMLSLAGGKNVAEEIDDSYWAEVSYEQILSWNPQCIVIASDASYTVEDVLNNENLMICDAVINGNVYKLPSNAEAWDSPVPSSVLGSLWLASKLYPEAISPETCYDVIDEYYETFYGFNYSSLGT